MKLIPSKPMCVEPVSEFTVRDMRQTVAVGKLGDFVWQLQIHQVRLMS